MFFPTGVRDNSRSRVCLIACSTPVFLMSDLEIADKRVIRCRCKRASWVTGSQCSHLRVTLTKTNGTFHISELSGFPWHTSVSMQTLCHY